MSKVYKSKKDKYIVYLPNYVIEGLSIKEGDEVAFTRVGEGFSFMKKSQVTMSTPAPVSGPSISSEELTVLRKLDSIKYNDRTKDRIKQVLNVQERKVLVGLIKRKLVSPFKKAGEQTYKYGIAKSIYNQFLYGQRKTETKQQQPMQQKTVTIQLSQIEVKRPEPKKWEKALGGSHTYLDDLEENGFLVVANQAEASLISVELEQSIRTGQVIGTRAFNKKYYITLKAFVNRNAPRVFKALGTKNVNVSEISKETEIPEEGCRAILYMLSENGEVTEIKRDVFKAVI